MPCKGDLHGHLRGKQFAKPNWETECRNVRNQSTAVSTHICLSVPNMSTVFITDALIKCRTSKSKHVIAYKVNSAAVVVRIWELFSTWSG
jgi:hypothetical protein